MCKTANFRSILLKSIILFNIISVSTFFVTNAWGFYRYKDNGTFGPIVGALTPYSAKIYYRPPNPKAISKLTLEYSKLYSMDSPRKVEIKISEDDDFVAHFSLKELEPKTVYQYRIKNGNKILVGDDGRLPSFTTFVSENDTTTFRFVVFADLCGQIPATDSMPDDFLYRLQDWTELGSYKNTVQEDYGFGSNEKVEKPALFFQIGDWDHRDPAIYSPTNLEYDIEQWRIMHRDVMYNLPSGKEFHEYIAPNLPVYHTWDDHDYGADDAGTDAGFKEIAQKAFLEYFPVPDSAYREKRLWFSFQYGHTEFFMLDTRSYRKLDPENPENNTMLGPQQLAWLKDRLKNSGAMWKFIMSSSTWNNHCSKQADNWNQFIPERQGIIDFCKENEIKGVVIISGDIHSGGAFDMGGFCNNPNSFPEISVPHTNNYSGLVSSGAGQTMKLEDGYINRNQASGHWDFFYPGACQIYKKYQYDPKVYYPALKFNAGYLIIEVHHDPLIEEYEEVAPIVNRDRTFPQPMRVKLYYPAVDWITIKIVNIGLIEDHTLGKILTAFRNPHIEVEEPKVIFEQRIEFYNTKY